VIHDTLTGLERDLVETAENRGEISWSRRDLLLRQYFPRGTDPFGHSQAHLDQIALRR
jgi:hypothetical protein